MTEKFGGGNVFDLTEMIRANRNAKRKTTIGIYEDGRISNPESEVEITTGEAVMAANGILKKYKVLGELLEAENANRIIRRRRGDMTNNTIEIITTGDLEDLLDAEESYFSSESTTTDDLLKVLDVHLKDEDVYPPYLIYSLARELIRRFQNSGN